MDNSPIAVAKFLISRKGLSKQMIGEFLGNLQKQFNSETLEYVFQSLFNVIIAKNTKGLLFVSRTFL